MRNILGLAALAATVSTANAAYQGFNYGNTFTDGSPKSESDFKSEFETASNLEGTNGDFTSARLYTMIQAGTTDDPISAIPAAIDTGTSLLLGLWASAGSDQFANEIEALRRAIDEYGSDLDGLVAGISVGSEDLYRNSPTGIENGSNPGAEPDIIVDYISQVRDVIEGTAFSDLAVGHVDTWTAWDNGSNSAVVEASDWIGFNGFAYFEDTLPNDISDGKSLFDRALGRTRDAVGNKPIWITETGWPVSGETVGEAVPSTENAETFYQEVGCPLFGETNTWWYLLSYSDDNQNPNFGVTNSELSTKPRYDLSCDGSSSPSGTSDTSSATPSATGGGGGGGGGGEDDGDDNGDDNQDDTEDDVEEGDDNNEGDDESTSPPPPPSEDAQDDTEHDDTEAPEGGEHHDDGATDEPEGDHVDDGEHAEHTDAVPVPPPSSPSEAPAPPAGGNDTAPEPQPTDGAGSGGDDGAQEGDGDEEGTVVDGASSMSYSAAFLAVMAAVAAF